MRYTENHPQQDLALALHLDKAQKTRIDNAITKAYGLVRAEPDGTVSVDNIIALVAPYINTAEEGFYAATTVISAVQSVLDGWGK